MARILVVAAALAVVAVTGGLWLYSVLARGEDEFAQCRESRVAGQAAIGGPFELVDGTGQTVTSAEVLDKPALVYFGYTFCPDVCPFDVARNADAVDLLQAEGYDVRPVFISIDPERDTPEVVGDFVSNMHEDMVGLTGSAEQVAAAADAYKAYFNARKNGDDPYYLVDHSTYTYLMLPEHGFVEFFNRQDSAEAMAGRTACFIDAAR